MGQFGAALSAMDVSAMKCEMSFPLECHQSAKVRTFVVKRVGATFGLALVPNLSNYSVSTAIHDVHYIDMKVPLLHIRTPIGNRWQESTIYS